MARADGRQIRIRRQRQGMRRRELAERAGISYQHMANVELGFNSVAPETIARLAKALGCDPEEVTAADRTVAS